MMSNPYGIKEVQNYHFPPSKGGVSDLSPMCTDEFIYLSMCDELIHYRNDACHCLYNNSGDLIAIEVVTYLPEVDSRLS